MSASGRVLPVVTVWEFPHLQPAMLSPTAGFGQARPSDIPNVCYQQEELASMKSRSQTVRAVVAGVCISASNISFADVPLYDFRQPVRDGVILVGMECNHKSQSLEIGIFDAGNPPAKRMDLWRTSDLVTYDAKTYMVTSIRHLERSCATGSDRYQVRFEGLPGAMNAMWMCGAVVTAKASVWKNGRLIYEQELSRCGADGSVRLARFVLGSDVPTLVKDEH